MRIEQSHLNQVLQLEIARENFRALLRDEIEIGSPESPGALAVNYDALYWAPPPLVVPRHERDPGEHYGRFHEMRAILRDVEPLLLEANGQYSAAIEKRRQNLTLYRSLRRRFLQEIRRATMLKQERMSREQAWDQARNYCLDHAALRLCTLRLWAAELLYRFECCRSRMLAAKLVEQALRTMKSRWNDSVDVIPIRI